MTDNAQILRAILREFIPANMQGQCDAAVTRYFAAIGKPVRETKLPYTAAAELRRMSLIEKDHNSYLTTAQRHELETLQQMFGEHQDAVSPLPESERGTSVAPVACDSCREKDAEIDLLKDDLAVLGDFRMQQSDYSFPDTPATSPEGAVAKALGRMSTARFRGIGLTSDEIALARNAYKEAYRGEKLIAEQTATITTLTAELAEARQGVEAPNRNPMWFQLWTRLYADVQTWAELARLDREKAKMNAYSTVLSEMETRPHDYPSPYKAPLSPAPPLPVSEQPPERPAMLLAKTGQSLPAWIWMVRDRGCWQPILDSDQWYVGSRVLEINRRLSDPRAVELYDSDLREASNAN